MKLLDTIMYLSVSLQSIGSAEQFTTNITGEVSLSLVESVYVVLKRDIGSVFFSTNITSVLSLEVGFGVHLHVVPEPLHVFILSATFDADNWFRFRVGVIFYSFYCWFHLNFRNDIFL